MPQVRDALRSACSLKLPTACEAAACAIGFRGRACLTERAPRPCRPADAVQHVRVGRGRPVDVGVCRGQQLARDRGGWCMPAASAHPGISPMGAHPLHTAVPARAHPLSFSAHAAHAHACPALAPGCICIPCVLNKGGCLLLQDIEPTWESVLKVWKPHSSLLAWLQAGCAAHGTQRAAVR